MDGSRVVWTYPFLRPRTPVDALDYASTMALFDGFRALPPYGLAGLAVLLLYAIQTEIRFGAKARSHSRGVSDRGSTIALSLAALLPAAGFILAMKSPTSAWIPAWSSHATLPATPAAAWAGVIVGVAGIAVRLWAVLTLRERYTRTLLTHEEHTIERGGPYRWVRHPGYLGSLLALNGVAMASGNAIALFASICATFAGYAYRIRVEDRMLVEAFGDSYAAYRRDVRALIPFIY